MLYAVNPEDDKSADGYILSIAGRVESKDNYRLFPAASANAWYKMDIVPIATKDGKPVATYDVFMHQNIPSSMVNTAKIWVRAAVSVAGNVTIPCAWHSFRRCRCPKKLLLSLSECRQVCVMCQKE